MKNFIGRVSAALLCLMTIFSCERDRLPEIVTGQTNDLVLKFDNQIKAEGSLLLGTTVLTSSTGQLHRFRTLKYIISNVVLIKQDGTEVPYELNNPDKGAYIVDQAEPTTTHNFILKNIPAGDYKALKFGLGISPKAYLLGQEGQASFWDRAKALGMTWSWASGYKFVNLEGDYGADLASPFKVHLGNIGNPSASGTPDVYQEVSLSFPQLARVREEIAPQVHIIFSVDHFLSGHTPIRLDASNDNEHHPSKSIVQTTAGNLRSAFRVDHIHNN